MRFFSLFTGIGGLEFGIRNKAESVGFSEINKVSEKIYLNHYPLEMNYGDLRKITKFPEFDILLGGFPCQSFSLKGFRKGFIDGRGKMIFYIFNLLKSKSPNYVVLENVKGIVSHNGGKTFESVLKLLYKAGYYVRVISLNALNYGSAQNRERVFFLGCKDDFEKKQVEIRDDSKRFRDIRDKKGEYNYINLTEFNKRKIEQKNGDYNYELIGGYDRVGALCTSYGGGEKLVYDEGRYRYLTISECEKLQNFPDGWVNGVSNSQAYAALGNAVNCNMSDYLFNDYLSGLWWQ